VNVDGKHVNTISTKRLTLRPLRENDLVNLAAAVNNLRIARNVASIPWPYDLDDARAFLDSVAKVAAGSASFAVLETSGNGSVIGVMGYQEAELGYWLAEPSWGKGFATEGAQAVVEHAFTMSRLDRLQARCILGNEPSRRILVGLGLRPTHIGSTYSLARRCHVVTQHFEVTVAEWRLRRKEVMCPDRLIGKV
jgi:RimJ/RimL family protein N-acetyltransferase